MMSCDDEMQTAASYFVLYAQIAADRTDHDDRQTSSATTPSATNIEDGAGEDQEFWAEDNDWDDERIEQANSMLEKNRALCDVEFSSARGSYLIDQFEQDAGKNWNEFYSRHATNFFKDRHYLHKTFPEEFGPLYYDSKEENNTSSDNTNDNDVDPFTVIEIGCGVGNTVLPLLERGETAIIDGKRRTIHVWGLDFAAVAIDLLKKDQRYIDAAAASATRDGRAKAEVWDITQPPPESYAIESISDVSILLFCLSAISPDKMPDAVRHAATTLKPGGTIVFRDYGRYDEAQMKLGTSRCKRLADNFYVKSDGTRCYYFDLDDLKRLFGEGGAGLEIIELKYLRRTYENRSQDVARRRVWVQGRFRKPIV